MYFYKGQYRRKGVTIYFMLGANSCFWLADKHEV